MGAASRRSWQKRQAEGRAEMSDQHKANLSRARRELFASGYKAPERTEEQRKKYSAASRRKWEDPELRQKTCSSIKASYTPELRELRGRLSRERWSDPEYREAMSEKTRQAHKEGRMPDLGTMSRLRWEDPAYREKMLSMLRDRAPPTEETREKLRQANLGKKHSLETRRKRSALTDEVAAEILHLRVAGKQHREIAHITGVSLVTVTRICHRERYQWVEPQIPLEALKYRHRGVKWQTLLESRRSHGP
jgi:hypothetical protein